MTPGLGVNLTPNLENFEFILTLGVNTECLVPGLGSALLIVACEIVRKIDFLICFDGSVRRCDSKSLHNHREYSEFEYFTCPEVQMMSFCFPQFSGPGL